MTDLIKVGDYIIITKHDFKKLHKFNKSNSVVNLGKDSVNLCGIEGKNYFSSFKMIPANHGKRNKEFGLELVEQMLDMKDEINVKVSGTDNRNIIDDGRSQKLTPSDIENLKSDSNKASDIVETLISNSNTFHNKTEFSQQKYLRKKEKKYYEYIQILKPNLRIISDILYKLDSNKIQNLRVDTLSQILTLSNICSEGTHLLYDSGSNGLVAAALLSSIGQKSNGKLINMHPGNMSQKQALLAMNFAEEQYNRCLSVNIYSVLRQYYQGCDTNNITDKDQDISNENEEDTEPKTKLRKLNNTDSDLVNDRDKPKKPKWHYDNISASELLEKKVDSLVIVCKEDPQNIFNELVSFVKASRPFVIYNTNAEPLQQMYVNLKCQSNIAALKLLTNWMRNYQILPERTHPDVTMNVASGYLLIGYVLK